MEWQAVGGQALGYGRKGCMEAQPKHSRVVRINVAGSGGGEIHNTGVGRAGLVVESSSKGVGKRSNHTGCLAAVEAAAAGACAAMRALL